MSPSPLACTTPANRACCWRRWPADKEEVCEATCQRNGQAEETVRVHTTTILSMHGFCLNSTRRRIYCLRRDDSDYVLHEEKAWLSMVHPTHVHRLPGEDSSLHYGLVPSHGVLRCCSYWVSVYRLGRTLIALTTRSSSDAAISSGTPNRRRRAAVNRPDRRSDG
jgi:hypothetical protein